MSSQLCSLVRALRLESGHWVSWSGGPGRGGTVQHRGGQATQNRLQNTETTTLRISSSYLEFLEATCCTP